MCNCNNGILCGYHEREKLEMEQTLREMSEYLTTGSINELIDAALEAGAIVIPPPDKWN